MSREIKFRAWDKCEGFMIDIKHFGFDEDGSFWYLLSEGDDVPYFTEQLGHSFELMQYTGLKDKNGVEIYEDDIVRTCLSDIKGEARWGRIVTKNPFEYSVEEALYINYADELEILGNIYENPELLKEQEDEVQI